jgi:hypothetical protein
MSLALVVVAVVEAFGQSQKTSTKRAKRLEPDKQ